MVCNEAGNLSVTMRHQALAVRLWFDCRRLVLAVAAAAALRDGRRGRDGDGERKKNKGADRGGVAWAESVNHPRCHGACRRILLIMVRIGTYCIVRHSSTAETDELKTEWSPRRNNRPWATGRHLPWDHSVTCNPTQVNAPRLNPSLLPVS